MSLKADVPLTERASNNWVGGSATVSAMVSKSRYIIHLGPPLGMHPALRAESPTLGLGAALVPPSGCTACKECRILLGADCYCYCYSADILPGVVQQLSA
jgi:hypothetical protein